MLRLDCMHAVKKKKKWSMKILSQLAPKDRVHTQYHKLMSTSIIPHIGCNNSHVPATQTGRGEPLEHEHILSWGWGSLRWRWLSVPWVRRDELPRGESREEKVEVHVLKTESPWADWRWESLFLTHEPMKEKKVLRHSWIKLSIPIGCEKLN